MSAFAIITDNGVVLDVAPDSKLTVEFVATTFNEETLLAGSYSYPVVFPFTPKNDQAFTHGRYLENRLGRKAFEVNICILDMSWKRGILMYDVTAKGYEAVVTIDNAIVADLMREKSIAEIFTITNKSKFVSHKSIRIGEEGEAINDKIVEINSTVGEFPFAMPTYLNPLITGTMAENSNIEITLVNDFFDAYRVRENGYYGAFFYLTWVIEQVCKFLGFRTAGSYMQDDFIRSLIIDNTGVRAGSDILETGTLNPAQHLPGITISDFFKALRNDHKVMIYFDSQTRTVYFEKATKILSDPNRLDVSHIQVKDSLKIKRQATGAYKLITKKDDSDDLYNVVPYEGSVVVGYTDTSKEVEMSIGRPFMVNVKLYDVNDVYIPTKQQLGNMYGEKFTSQEQAYNADNMYNKNSFAFRLLSYKGSESFDFVKWIGQATTDDKGSNGNVYDDSLALGGEKGMINRFSLPWYSFYCLSEQVEVEAKFDVIQFMKVNPLQKLLITGENRAKIEAFMDRVTFEPNVKGSNIMGKILCYPHYDLNAVAEDFRVVVNEPENVLPTGLLYVKLFMTNLNAPTFQQWWCDIVLEFYQDQACTIPAVSVNNIPVNLKNVVKDLNSNQQKEENDLGQVIADSKRYNAKQGVYWHFYPYNGYYADFKYYAEDPSPVSTQKFQVVGQYRVLNGVITPYD